MKTNSTFFKYAVVLIAVFFSAFTAKADNNNPPQLTFANTPTLVSGVDLQIGAVYKFTNVANGADALVTIVSATGGATVAMLDDNALTKPEAFSPRITVPANSTGLVTFKIDFINGGGNPKNLTQFSATAMDIDGTLNTLYEMDAINMGAGSIVSYLSSLLEINVTQTGSEFLGKNFAGNEYPAVDTSAKQVMFTVTSPLLINSFTYAAGVENLHTEAVTRQKGIYFKGFDYLAFLPVKYGAFEAVANDNIVNLKWITETEINNHHFEVERSFDGVNFKSIGSVLNGFAAGNTGKAYMFKDNSSALSDVTIAYYRLKQVDLDGRYAYSNTLAVRLGAISNVKMQVTPNPFVENLAIRFNADAQGTAQVQIMNMQGQPVLVQNVTVNKGTNNIQIMGLSKLGSGTYIARLYTAGAVTATQKIIKN